MPSIDSPPTAIGCPIPANTPHAVSVTLPSWSATVAYEEGQEWVVSKMKSGYPRFFYHELIQQLCALVASRYSNGDERSLIFPSYTVACQCREFVQRRTETKPTPQVRVVEITIPGPGEAAISIAAVLFPPSEAGVVKQFWQHTGDGISSRLAEYALAALQAEPKMAAPASRPNTLPRSFRRYARNIETEPAAEPVEAENEKSREFGTYLEERFGRNLDTSFHRQAKVALRRRIAGTLDDSVDLSQVLQSEPQQSSRSANGLTEEDVFMYPCGMSAIYHAHQLLLAAFEPAKSVCFGFPYIDTLKILEKWGPGCVFYGRGECDQLDELEALLASGERIMALFCEFPSNPLLKCADLDRISALASKYNFLVVVDETIGNFLNIHVLDKCDIVVSSLTKIFSGDSNVMGGSLVLNPASPHYETLKKTLAATYEDNLFFEDAIFLERNSRDFASRIVRVNTNAEALADMLLANELIKAVYYPKYGSTNKFYEARKAENGGYGGLLSIEFHDPEHAVLFFDRVRAAKGPSLGTNFTLLCPYTILAHYLELDWAAQYGVHKDLVRISVGLEPTDELVASFNETLKSLTAQ
ncbi:pyridoxal phosphate-dependent transferase [Dipodascopsis tothii]|uniref:pyridoxal phosphate-dependent transferase n=1 Tax=Dipodascopsis tothii TaxID=44089 RepID=UPI0034CF8DAC